VQPASLASSRGPFRFPRVVPDFEILGEQLDKVGD
jgi:hypothetical protein